MFAFFVFLLTIVPACLALLEFLVSLRHIREICNWKRDYFDEKESFVSSEENSLEAAEAKKKANLSEDLIRGEGDTDESLVEKEITLSDSEENKENSKSNESDGDTTFDNKS